MSEIEKMYKNAEPNRDCNLYKHFTECPMKHTQCEDCENFVYPPFTAEKQLELIKLLSYYYNITISKNFENDYTFQCEGDDVRRYVFTSGQDFAEQIASFVNMCYELLPEEERKQIKEILE